MADGRWQGPKSPRRRGKDAVTGPNDAKRPAQASNIAPTASLPKYIDCEHFNQLAKPGRQACRHSFRRLQSQSRPVAGESAGRFGLPLRGGPQGTDQEHAPPRSSAECRQARTGDDVQGPAGLASRLQLIRGWSVQIWQGHIEEKVQKTNGSSSCPMRRTSSVVPTIKKEEKPDASSKTEEERRLPSSTSCPLPVPHSEPQGT